jgi:ATP-dependent Clp protease ATP-binding subunit ClpA
MFQRLTTSARLAVGYAESAARTVLPAGPAHGRARPEIEPVHLLLGLLRDDEGDAVAVLTDHGISYLDVLHNLIARRAARAPGPESRGPRPPAPGFSESDEAALRALGIDLAEVLARAEATYGPDAFASAPPADRGPRPSKPRLSRSSRSVLSSAVTVARTVRSGSISSEHLLLGLLRVDDPDVHATLLALGVEPDALLAATVRTIGEAA